MNRSSRKLFGLFTVASLLLCPAITSAEGWAETLELSCHEQDGTMVAEHLASKALKKSTKFEQSVRCNDLLSSLLASGFGLASLSHKDRITTYLLEGSVLNLAIGSDRPDPVATVRCVRDDFRSFTCTCTWASECNFLRLMCSDAGSLGGHPIWKCDKNYDSAAARVENALGKLSANQP